jgi:hypothetical protein
METPMTLREKLIALQSTEELERKARKARRRSIWTQEEIDAARRAARELYELLNWGCPDAEDKSRNLRS